MDLGQFEISLDVRDIAKSLAFYEALGFELVDGSVEIRVVTVQKGDCRIALYQGYLDPPVAQLTFWNGDVDEIARDLKAKGLEFEKEPFSGDGGGRAALIKDPDGYPIYFINMADGERT